MFALYYIKFPASVIGYIPSHTGLFAILGHVPLNSWLASYNWYNWTEMATVKHTD